MNRKIKFKEEFSSSKTSSAQSIRVTSLKRDSRILGDNLQVKAVNSCLESHG